MPTLQEIVKRSKSAVSPEGMDKTSGSELTREKVSAAIGEAYDRGASDERERADSTRARLAHFEGQVMAHALAAKLMHAKVSMANNKCWDCGTRAYDPEDSHRRCAVCAANHQ
jgi:hypothetical protein